MGPWERLGRAVGLLALVATLSAASAGGGLPGSEPAFSPAEAGTSVQAPSAGASGLASSDKPRQAGTPAETTELAPGREPGDSGADASPAASASSAPSEGESPAVAEAPRPRLVSHVVAKGETVTGIAERYGLRVSTVTAASGLGDPNRIFPGQTLVFPSVDGLVYRVKPGDTLTGISATYQTKPDAVTAANEIADPDRLDVGQLLILPGGRPVVAVAAKAAPAVSTASASPAGSGARLAWPLRGTLSSRFGLRWGRMHSGIDIAAPYGATIRAAGSGRVTFAGWYGHYGRCVIIDHGGGRKTLYAHASVLSVAAGESVTQGQAIGEVGTSGNSTGPHLHFEVRVGEQPQNPMNYLGG